MKLNRIFNWLEKRKDLIYIFGLLIFIASSFFISYFSYPDTINAALLKAFRLLSLIIVASKIILVDVKKYSKKRALMTLVIIAVLFASAIISANKALLWVAAMVTGAYEIDFKKILKYTLFLEVFLLTITVLLSVTGFVPDILYTRGGIVRHSLGFRYTTYLAFLLLGVSMGWFYLRNEIAKWYEYVFFIILAALTFVLTNTRFEPICVIIVVCFFWVYRYLPKLVFKRVLAFLSEFLIILAAILSIFITNNYDKNNTILKNINSITSDRLELIKEAEEQYGISVFGAPIKWVGMVDVKQGRSSMSEFNAVDNVYVRLLLNFGISALVIFLILQFCLAHNAIKKKDIKLQFILILIAGYSIFSPRMVELPVNQFMLLYPAMVVSSGKKSGIRDEKK